MPPAIKRLITNNFEACCVAYMINDIVTECKYRLGNINTQSGTAHKSLGLEQSLSYVEEVFSDYKHYSGVSRFHGRVAEIGPGDSVGVALLFLNEGCSKIDLVDRFYSERDQQKQDRLYERLIEIYPSLRAFRNREKEEGFDRIVRHYGERASAEEFFTSHRDYDFIVSRAVLEHVYAPDTAIRQMTVALNVNGMLLHKVDLRDHGLFSGTFHELKFLEVPAKLYSRMTRASGRPNRFLIHRYREVLDTLPLEYTILVTRLAGVGDIIPHVPYSKIPEALRERSRAYVRSTRSKFDKEFEQASDEDLSIAGFFLIARKTSHNSGVNQ